MSHKLPVKIALVDRLDGDSVLVTYSDSRTVVYSAEQLSTLTPKQVMTEEESLLEESTHQN